MRKDLVFQYLSTLEVTVSRLDGQLSSESYKNLIQGQSKFAQLTVTEIEFMIDRLLSIQSSLEKLELSLDKEREERKSIS